MHPLQFTDPLLLDRAHRHALDFLSTAATRHVGARAGRDEILRALGTSLPREGEDPQRLLDALAALVDRAAVASISPRYYGYVIGGVIPVSLAAEWLTAAWDQNAGLFQTSPLTSVIEDIVSGWLLDLFNLPRESSVGFVTGAQMAHFTALAAARNALLRNAGWDVESRGLAGAPRITVAASEEIHTTIKVALRYLGLGTSSILSVRADEQGRMLPRDLRRVLDDVNGPTIVCAQAGNVNTGAIDPLRAIGEIALDHDAWLHIDGAIGLWAAASSERRSLLDGLELADSWSTDAHKWLNTPYDCGIVIVADSAAHHAAMSTNAAYIDHDLGAERHPLDWTPEFSRRARAIPVWAAMRYLGTSGIEQIVDRTCARARQMAALLDADPLAEVLNDVTLNQVLVRFHDHGTHPDEVTRETIARVQQDGTCWVGGTTWKGMAAMRISFSNWATSSEDVERSAEAILRCAAAARGESVLLEA